jgi:peptide/nickel transport system substrate-binding protein
MGRIAAWAVCLGMVLGCDAVAPPAARSTTRSLRVAILADEGTLQPYTYVTGYPGWSLLTLVYDTLFVFDAQNQPQPWIARTHTISADGLTHTLSLRDDVRWHDGRRLTSDDVRFAYTYYQAHPHGRWSVPVGNISRIETPDPVTVVLHFETADPSVPFRLLADVPIIPRHIWDGVVTPKTVDAAVGSGPFRLTDYRPDQFYRFTANRDYFAGPARVDELLVPIIKDPGTIFAALRTGEIDATAEEVPAELTASVEGDPNLKAARGAGYATTVLQFNAERAPWSDARVRRAVAWAIDARKLVDTLLLGQGTPGHPGWLHPTSPLHDRTLVPVVDRARAKESLEEAGLIDRDGDGVRDWRGAPVAPTLLVQANNPTLIRAAELVAAAVRTIGIDARVRSEDPASVDAQVWPDFDVSKGRNFDWALFGWSPQMLIDPFRIVALVDSDRRYGTHNIGGFRDPEADRLSAQVRSASTSDAWRSGITRLEGVIARERPFVLLWYPDLTFAYDPRVYDGWVFQPGHGILHKLSFLPPHAH